jgi:polynucleotide 5'-hydroxyl-kinase GRC3/NOL9
MPFDSRSWCGVDAEVVLREGEIPDDWMDLIEAIHRKKGSALILGASDTGKSTLAHLLVVHLCQMGNVVALIDGDIGQSVLGLPTTIGLALFDSAPKQLESIRLIASYFVGSITPRGHMLEMLVGVKRIADKASQLDPGVIVIDTTGFVSGETAWELKASQLDPGVIVIDTTGFVSGETAWELKFQKVDLLKPAHLIGLQRRREIEGLLRPHQFRRDMAIHRLKIPEKVRIKSPEQRKSNRSRKFAAYFQEVKLYEKSLDGIKVVSPFKVRYRGKGLKGVLIGLNDEANFNLGLGILENLDVHRGAISFVAPELDPTRIRLIRIGSIEVDLFGNDKTHDH